jgi:outer membrane protein assembly factor BamB
MRDLSLGSVGSRYYNGVRVLRTTISCVAAVFLCAFIPNPVRADGLFFPLKPKWSAALTELPGFPPAYDRTQAYIALRNSTLVAFSLDSGEQRWSVECPTSAAPVVGDALVFTATEGKIQARLDVDGKIQWEAPVDGAVASLFWSAGWLLATTDKGSMLAMRAVDGEVLWRRDLGGALEGVPAPAGDRLYVAMHSGALLTLTLQTGEPVWTTQFDEPISGILALEDRVFVGSLDNRFYCLSARRGDRMWSWRTGADVIGVPVTDNSIVYFVSLDNVLRAVDRNNGSMKWTKSMPTRPSAGPVLRGHLIMVPGITAEIHAFSSVDGSTAGEPLVLLSAQKQELQFLAPPHVTPDDTVVTITRGGQLLAFVGSPSPFGP